MPDASTPHLQGLIERLNGGDPSACSELINRSSDRLRRLTVKILRDFGRVHRWEDTDDVFQNASLRLYKALDATPLGKSAANSSTWPGIATDRKGTGLIVHRKHPPQTKPPDRSWKNHHHP
jgi:hypothetical protein